MELRSLHLDVGKLTTRVRANHPERVVDCELGAESTQRILAGGEPLVSYLRTSGRLPPGGWFDELWLDAEAQTVAVRCGEAIEALDYQVLQTLLRELARTARREAVARKPDPPGLSPEARWEYLYQHGGDGWEMGKATPPLVRYLTAHPPLRGERSLVVGCGRGHEALLLARLGPPESQVVGIDIAPAAVAIATRQAAAEGLSDRVTFLQQDLFGWPTSDASQRGQYDLVVEHNCFCAIEPHRRDEYVQAVAALLRPGGRLVGLFYTHDYPGGPPYAARAEEIRTRLRSTFEITYEEVPADSAITRAGQELLVQAVRRHVPLPNCPPT